MTDIMGSIPADEVEEYEERMQRQEEAMRADGVATEAPRQQSYFGFDVREQVFLPDNISYVEIRPLSEGDRRKYMNDVQKEARLQRATGDMIVKMQTGEERYQLLMRAIIGWNLVDANGSPQPFSSGSPGSTLGQFLEKAEPRIVDIIHKAVMKQNPWLMAELSVEDIDKQIEELQELRAAKIEEEAGNGN